MITAARVSLEDQDDNSRRARDHDIVRKRGLLTARNRSNQGIYRGGPRQTGQESVQKLLLIKCTVGVKPKIGTTTGMGRGSKKECYYRGKGANDSGGGPVQGRIEYRNQNRVNRSKSCGI